MTTAQTWLLTCYSQNLIETLSASMLNCQTILAGNKVGVANDEQWTHKTKSETFHWIISAAWHHTHLWRFLAPNFWIPLSVTSGIRKVVSRMLILRIKQDPFSMVIFHKYSPFSQENMEIYTCRSKFEFAPDFFLENIAIQIFKLFFFPVNQWVCAFSVYLILIYKMHCFITISCSW